MSKYFGIFLMAFFFSMEASAQFIQQDVIVGTNKYGMNQVLVQPIDEKGHFEFSGLAFFNRYYKGSLQHLDEVGVQGIVFWKFTDDLGVGPGLYYNSPVGIMKKVAFEYTYFQEHFSFFISPGVYHIDQRVEGDAFMQLEYRIPFNSLWSLSVQLQSLAVFKKFREYTRGYQYFRVGPRITGTFEFGLSADFDQFGPSPVRETTASYGLYVRKIFR
ncbi:MAG TPA: hypothetical protein VJ876_01240 [Bacteroidales bacterium]|nr:hypothetical protein [Bacteroidales bacterium]